MTLGLTRWTPTSDLFRDRFSRLLEHAMDDSIATSDPTKALGSRHWMPAVDIKESDEALTLSAELPGLGKGDISLTVEDNVLTLTGERVFEKDAEKESYHRIERAYGAFSRSFTLPSNVRTDSVEATFIDGVVTIVIPKADEAKARNIEIQ
ncbi:MAG: Hsp20/alpha crystallin family protein [Deltaproteobacteria bacterium]|nr:Hsp20/alpha crystallin family protein [Deltaproteobacteria bacterium]